MNNKQFSKRLRWCSTSKSLAGGLVAVALLLGASPATARAPDWLRALARTPLPDYPEETEAVMLLNEQIVTVDENGQIKKRYRRAYKILRPEGRSYGLVKVYFDNETKLTYLKAWSLPAGQKEYEVKEKDAVETSPFSYVLYQDTRYKWLRIPAAEPGSVVGYEYEQKARPFILQDGWWVAETIPVRRALYTLELPGGWEFKSYWLHHDGPEPRSLGKNRYAWELEDIPAVETERAMPDWRAVATRLLVSFYPSRESLRGKSHASWHDVGRWYARLAAGRRQATPEIKQQVADLTAATPNTLDKLRALAAFAQRSIRYVAIEIGIGGYQPHSAQDVFANRYGDCKDKATLLSSMLREIGVDSYYVLVHTSRGVVAPNFPSALSFNHAILAIQLPDDVPTTNLYSIAEHNELGRLLFFDPTNPLTPLGYLPATEQANYGLLVAEDGGELLELPLLLPGSNRLLRTGRFVLRQNGDLAGEVKEIRWGAPAASRRGILLRARAPERRQVLEDFLANSLGDFSLLKSLLENLEESDQNLVSQYSFVARSYAKQVGDLLLVRPRVLGQKSSTLLEEEERKFPVEFAATSLQTDLFEITFPAGYHVEDLPVPVQVDYGFAEYRSTVEVEGNVLRYRRYFRINEVLVPRERLDELKEFYRRIAADELNSAVLRRSVQ